jgi:hypothetical protein
MLIICTKTAAVLELNDCKTVDSDSLTEEQLEPLWYGSNAEIIQLATVHGKPINSIK